MVGDVCYQGQGPREMLVARNWVGLYWLPRTRVRSLLGYLVKRGRCWSTRQCCEDDWIPEAPHGKMLITNNLVEEDLDDQELVE